MNIVASEKEETMNSLFCECLAAPEEGS
uniref:Uncharacterized protein n=1 Tax=Anguilla anguilla TaxID=7936 RepID=A0A0E9QD67_ANGAN